MGSDELLSLVLSLIERLAREYVPSQVLQALSGFRDQRVLDWIEAHAAEPVGYEWGTAAAVNGMTWQRVVRWLAHGRPLSLVALDAMKNCRGFDPADQNMSGIFRDEKPTIWGGCSPVKARAALAAYYDRDADPRVRETSEIICQHLPRILGC